MQAIRSQTSAYLRKMIARGQDTWRIAREDRHFLLMTWLARFVVVREWVGRSSSFGPEEDFPQNTANVVIADPPSICAEVMASEGYYTGLSLCDEKIQQILTFAFTTPCYGNRNRHKPLWIDSLEAARQRNGDQPYQVASYQQDIERCEVVLSLKSDPLLLALAKRYIGHDPVYYRSELLWTFPENPSSEIVYTRYLHCDINDYRNVKFFFYLTEVDRDSGPHSYLKGSHKRRGWLQQLRGGKIYPDQEAKLIAFYGADKLMAICGPAGAGFMGDPYCLHRGGLPKQTARLMLQLEFGSRLYQSCHAHLK